MAAIAYLPPSHYQQERIICSITAAEKYAVPANILLAIAEKENGKNRFHTLSSLAFLVIKFVH